MNNEKIKVEHPVIMFRLNKNYYEGISSQQLYQNTRSSWVLSKKKKEKAQYAFSVYKGVIKEVYRIESWESTNNPGRFAFVGEVAEDAVRNQYLDGKVAEYFPKGAANPVRYFNID